MKFKVSIYSPDSHISYNLKTLDFEGVGGGVTNRIRIAHALKSLGCDVTLYVNSPENQTLSGVQYNHYSNIDYSSNTDVFIASTSGGNLDLSKLELDKIDAQLLILLVHGIHPPIGIPLDSFDYIYVPSNFVRQQVINHWSVNPQKIFTSHLGIKNSLYRNFDMFRDPYCILYSGHPMKGLESTLNVLKIVRTLDPRFTLQVFGSPKLWGEKDEYNFAEEGVFFHGTIGQRKLTKLVQKCTYGLFLQDIPEAFGLSVIETMRAGCIPIASPVGAMTETIQHGYNGFLVQGTHSDLKTQNNAAELIFNLSTNERFSKYISSNCINSPSDWSNVANVYLEHWNHHFNGQNELTIKSKIYECPNCAKFMFQLSDGFHCNYCGNFAKSIEKWA